MSSSTTSRLFQPLKLGSCNLQNRVVMPPLTRCRADAAHVPQQMAADYYSQRASVPGTLLITEGTFISPRAGGLKHVPGIWSSEQIAAWKKVTEAVHSKGSFIFCQLWALGRAAQAEVLKEESGNEVVGASVMAMEGGAVPRPLSVEEIKSYVSDYVRAARNAIEAGFDGVEIHGANGYLLDQFTQDVSNQRLDIYGGSVENRSRFGLEVSEAVAKAIGKERVGYRISPYNTFQGMRMKDPVPQFSHHIKGLAGLGLAYLHSAESWRDDTAVVDDYGFIFDAWTAAGAVILAGGYTPEMAFKAVDETWKTRDVAVAFGRHFISTPDLVHRLKHSIKFNPYNRKTFYTPMSEEGYTDYPFSKEWQAVAT